MILLLGWGCVSESAESALPAETGTDDCDGVPLESWENFGAGFTLHECQVCHASTATDRQGAPPSMPFDTPEEVWAYSSAVLRSAGGEPPSMPPLGGTSTDDRERLRAWLECGEPGS